MTGARPDTIMCMMSRLGSGVAGGKINAIFRRVNMLADRGSTQVVLLGLDHGVTQKVAFAQLQQDGIIDARVQHRSLHEVCYPADHTLPDRHAPALPDWDQQIAKGGRKQRISYFADDVPVMRDTFEQTAAGLLVNRQILTDPARDVRLKYLDGDLVEGVARFGDGIVHKTFYVDHRAVCEVRLENREVQFVDSAITGQRYFNQALFQKELVARAFPKDCLLFVDGITSVPLAQHIDAKKILFLHANHRNADGKVLQRSKRMIEAFDGDKIVTATERQKARLHTDLLPSCPIHVLPHYADPPIQPHGPRAHICTVSRLRLFDKPVHHCITAFTRIMHLIPDCNYHIYGSGPDEARLEQMIRHLNCGDRVILKGHTATPDQVFASSLLSLAPTMTEGFGLSLLEALTQGCPVISFDVDYGPRELIQPGHNGELVSPGDIAQLSQAILRVHAQRQSYSDASFQSAKHYTFDAYSARYLALVQEVLGNDRFFDITAPDLRIEVKEAYAAAPKRDAIRLLDLFIDLCAWQKDVAGMYWAFCEKHRQQPDAERPLMRCIWLSRRLGKLNACRHHLGVLHDKFPQQHAAFIAQYPAFDALADSEL